MGWQLAIFARGAMASVRFRLASWRNARVRAWGRNTYIRVTPNFGFGLSIGRTVRVRFSWYHGLQMVRLIRGRWYIWRQLLGRSKVKGERSASVC